MHSLWSLDQDLTRVDECAHTEYASGVAHVLAGTTLPCLPQHTLQYLSYDWDRFLTDNMGGWVGGWVRGWVGGW